MTSEFLHPISRFFVALIFLVSGAGKIFSFGQTSILMTSVGFPFADLFLIGAIVIEIVGGIGLLLGFKTSYAAVSLIFFVIAATIMFHTRFIGDPAIGQEQIAHTLKNIAIIGGLLKFVTDGSVAFSIDKRREKTEVVV